MKAQNMNHLIVNFLPSIIRGVYRFDDEIESLEELPKKIDFIYNKLDFLPKYIQKYAINNIFDIDEQNANQIINDRFRNINIKEINAKFNTYVNHHGLLNDNQHELEKQFIRKIIVYVLTAEGMDMLLPQKQIGSYKVDFAIEGEKKYVFEIDGFTKFDYPDAFNSFIERQNFLTSQGWIVYRYTYHHVIKNTKQKIKELFDIFTKDNKLKNYLEIDILEKITGHNFDQLNNFLDPIDFVNLFYKVQDTIAFKIMEDNSDEETEITIKDDFKDAVDDFPLVYFAILDLYHFLDSVENIFALTFSLPKINIKTPYNKRAEYNKFISYHNKIIRKPYNNVSTDEIIIDTNLKYTETKSNRIFKNEDVNFRILSFEDIKNSLSYITYSIFGYKEGTKDFQNKVLKKIFERKNVLGIFPTGSGKSFCFWLPAILKPGLAIVICPLRSLMRDQYQSLINYGLSSVAFINSDVAEDERDKILLDIIFGRVKLLYVAPERMRIDSFIRNLKTIQKYRTISYLVIDEAHCISEWGHDFRPSYLHIPFFYKELKQANKDISLIALTATASEMVKSDILRILNLSNDDVVSATDFDRINFSYQIIKVTNREDKEKAFNKVLKEDIPRSLRKNKINEVLESNNNNDEKNMGLIYVIYADPHSNQSIYDGLSHYLYKTMDVIEFYDKYDTKHYGTGKVRVFSSKEPLLCPKCHSYKTVRNNTIFSSSDFSVEEDIVNYTTAFDEDDDNIQQGMMRCLDCNATDLSIRPDRYSQITQQNQRDFKLGKFDVMVATKGFGMGIDKGSIRFVVHTSFSSGIEGWYQEAGRAGRDNERSHCVVIAEMPSKECIKRLREASIKAPTCNTRGKCPDYRKSPCDYAKQHMFIRKSYPSVEADTKYAIKVFYKLIDLFVRNNNNSIRFPGNRNNSGRQELALFRLKVLNVINDFSVIYDGLNPNFNIIINTNISHYNEMKEIIKKGLINHLAIDQNSYEAKLKSCIAKYKDNLVLNEIKNNLANNILFDLIIDNLLILMDYTYDNILKMRYQMLYNLLNVVYDDTLCRRPSILGYFNASEVNFEDGYNCGLCDKCKPDLNFKDDTRKPSDKVKQEKEIIDTFERLLKEKVFDIDKLIDYLSHAKDYPKTWYKRASFVLEGAPNNLVAIFFCRELCLEEERLGYSKRLIETAKIYRIDINTIKKIYDTTKPDYKWECLKILDDKNAEFKDRDGIQWLLEEAKKLYLGGIVDRELEKFIIKFQLFLIAEYIKKEEIKKELNKLTKTIRGIYNARNN